jgi:hypothetical protein
MRRRTLGLLGGVIVLGSGLWLACGGSDGASDALTQPAEAGTLSETGTGADTGTNPGTDAATGTDASDAATAQQEAGGGDGGISTNDSGTGPGGSTTILTCGSTTCAIPTQNCCVERIGGGKTAFGCAATCPSIDAGADTAALKCSGQANCAAGTVCCVSQAGANGATSQCQATCTANQAQLCDPKAVPTGCGGDAGNACSNQNIGDWALPQTFGTCGGKGN